MFESGYYPAGAECDPSAPYNEPADNEPVGVEVDVYVQLSKNDKVYTCDYVFDEDGYDFSDACFRQDWQDQSYSIPDMLKELEGYILRELATDDIERNRRIKLEDMLRDCRGWKQEEIEIDKI